MIRSVSRVTAARANASSVFQLFSFLVVCSGMISKGFVFMAFFASVKASSVCIHLSCLVCLQSVVRGVCSHLFCGHKGCSPPEVSVTSFLPLQFLRLCKAVRVQFSDIYKNVGKISVLYIFKIFSVLTLLNNKNTQFAQLNRSIQHTYSIRVERQKGRTDRRNEATRRFFATMRTRLKSKKIIRR